MVKLIFFKKKKKIKWFEFFFTIVKDKPLVAYYIKRKKEFQYLHYYND